MEPIHNPPLPYLLTFPRGFVPGCILHLTGTFGHNANSLIVKLQTGPNGDPNDEIGLCLYGRFTDGHLGRNSFNRTQGWGIEDSTPTPALTRGQPFDIAIMSDHNHYKIAVNHQHLAEYNHRVSVNTINHLSIPSTSQDLNISCIWLEDPASGPAPPSYQPCAVPPGLYPSTASPQHRAPTCSPPEPPSPSNYPPQAQALLGFGKAPTCSPPGPPSPTNYPPQAHVQPGGYQNTPHQQQQRPPQQGYQNQGPPQQGYRQYPGGPCDNKAKDSKGLLGMVGAAGAAVAGALGASHVLGKTKKSHGYPGYSGYPAGGHGTHKGSGGILGKAMSAAPALAGAAMVMKPKKALKYGLPIAGVGMGGYMLHKGMKGFHGGSSGSSGGSS